MNNCYGSTNDMQLVHLKIYPEVGETSEIFVPVPDTDDAERLETLIDEWVFYNLQLVDHYKVLDSLQRDL